MIKVNYNWLEGIIFMIINLIFGIYVISNDGFTLPIFLIIILIYFIMFHDLSYLELHKSKIVIKNDFRLLYRKQEIEINTFNKIQFLKSTWRPTDTPQIVVFYTNNEKKNYRFSVIRRQEVLVFIQELKRLNVNVVYNEVDWV